jgi:ribosomal protein S18 acetylase RimI-like enzyme
MTAADGAALVRLHRRAILLVGVRAYSPVMAHSWAAGLVPEAYLEAQQAGQAIEVAELFGAVVGFCGMKDDEILGLYVDPGFSGHGVGRALAERAFDRISEAGHDQVRVIAALSGVGFYEAMGFRPRRGLRHATRGGLAMPVLEMLRDLDPAVPWVRDGSAEAQPLPV